MERVIVNEGTKVNLYNLFEDLQNYTSLNSYRLLNTLIASYGINAATNLDGSIASSDTSLQVGPGLAGSYVTVEPGGAITQNLSWLNLSATTNVSVGGLSYTTHTLYMTYTPTYDTPTDVLSGFAMSLAGGTQKNTRAHDTYTFVWDVNPGVSGIALAVVNVTPGANTITNDLRSTNVLKFKASVIPASSFMGNQATSTSAPPPPLNFRIVDINGAAISTVIDPTQANAASRFVATGTPSQELALDVAWNWDNCSWTLAGGDNVNITLNPGIQTVADGALINYHLWHPYGYDFLITANVGGVITATPFGTNTTSINALPPVTAGGVIHCDASAYDVLTIPVASDGTYVLTERYEDKVTAPYQGNQAPVLNKTKIYPYVGERDIIKIRSLGPLGQASAYTIMPAGSFTSNVFLSPINYGSPFIAVMPFVSDNGSSVAGAGQAGGFTITLSTPATGGWSNASSFEVIWATDLNSLTFNSLSNTSNSVITTSKNIGIAFPSITSATDYYVKVRPLIGGIACSTGLPAVGGVHVVVGATSAPTIYRTVINNPHPAKTYSGTLIGPYTYTTSVKNYT
jgi:hypothetical protein